LMNQKELSVSDDIDSRCLKCKLVTNHTIVAIVEGRVAKVQCNVCGGRHNYRSPVVEKTSAAKRQIGKKTTGKASGRLSAEMKAAANFEILLGERGTSESLPYSMTVPFNEGDLIDHPTFGLGVVINTLSPKKIEVIFKQGSKVLVCGAPQ